VSAVQRLRSARLRDEPGRVPRRAVGELAALHEHDVALARRRQVVGDRRPMTPPTMTIRARRGEVEGQDGSDVEVAVGEVLGAGIDAS
jgi:hypothetical protein